MRLFVGNLPWSIDTDGLREVFSQFGEVKDSKVIEDRETGRSRGFGFVELDDAGAKKAIEEMNGTEVDGREIVVNEAQERPPRRNF